MPIAATTLLLATGFLLAADPPMLTEAPGRGALREGQRVLVDDRSCPAGQVREIIGGSNAQARGGGGATPPPRARAAAYPAPEESEALTRQKPWRCTTRPPTSVSSARVSRSRSGSTASTSCDSTTRSASLPGSIEPSSASAPSSTALLRV